MLRIALISHTGRVTGGSSHSLVQIAGYLKDYYELLVVLPENGELRTTLEKQGIRVCVHPIRRKSIPGLIRLFRRENISLVYANNFSVQSYFTFFAARLLFLPFVWHIRETVRREPATPAVLYRMSEAAVVYRMSKALRFATLVIANSNATASHLRELVPHKKLKIITNGVDMTSFPTAPVSASPEKDTFSNLKVINIGRVTKAKNQADVIEVARIVVSIYPDTEFLLLGDFQDPDYVEQLKYRISELRLEANVRLLGYQHDAPKLVSESSLMLHTSRNETQGRVILEAMAAELPVVAYAVGGVCESVIDEETGYLVPFGDIETAAQRVCDLLGKPAIRVRMGRNGRKRVEENYTTEITSQQVKENLDQILRNKRKRISGHDS